MMTFNPHCNKQPAEREDLVYCSGALRKVAGGAALFGAGIVAGHAAVDADALLKKIGKAPHYAIVGLPESDTWPSVPMSQMILDGTLSASTSSADSTQIDLSITQSRV